MSDVLVKVSRIQGRGVFAERDFGEGEEILKIDDSYVVEDFDKLSSEDQHWCDFLGDGKTILMQAPERFINHSCDPNSYLKTIQGVRTLFAMRDVTAGEEIAYDYAINGYYDGDLPQCTCGSQNCRGILNSNFFKLPHERQLQYLPYLDAWFKEKFRGELEKIAEGDVFRGGAG